MTSASCAHRAPAALQIADKMGAHAPWVLKDPRLCLSSPLWLSVLKDPMCIIIYKNPREVGRQWQAGSGSTEAGSSRAGPGAWGVLPVPGVPKDGAQACCSSLCACCTGCHPGSMVALVA